MNQEGEAETALTSRTTTEETTAAQGAMKQIAVSVGECVVTFVVPPDTSRAAIMQLVQSHIAKKAEIEEEDFIVELRIAKPKANPSRGCCYWVRGLFCGFHRLLRFKWRCGCCLTWRTNLWLTKEELRKHKGPPSWIADDDSMVIRVADTTEPSDENTMIIKFNFPDEGDALDDEIHICAIVTTTNGDTALGSQNKLRKMLVDGKRFDRVKSSEGTAQRIALCGWLSTSIAIGLGVYLYMMDANLLRGTMEDIDPDNDRLWSVAIPRFVMWLCTVLAGAFMKLKDYYDLKSNEMKLPLSYGTFD